MGTELRDTFKKLMESYGQVYEEVYGKADWKNDFRNVVHDEIPSLLYNSGYITDSYTIEGSYGKGRWTKTPWIAVFNKNITTSAQKGVYIVYLLNKDLKEIYLSLSVAATEVNGIKTDTEGQVVFTGVNGKASKKLKGKLIPIVLSIRNKLQDRTFAADENIHTGAEGYDFGAVYYKKYTLNDLPADDSIFLEDLKKMLEIYKRYYEEIYLKQSTGGDAPGDVIVETEAEETETQEEQDTETSPIGGEHPMPEKDNTTYLDRVDGFDATSAIEKIKAYIASKGFHYDGKLIENFYLCLKAKPFVLLAGTSGTGKTRLVKLFAEAVGAEYKLVPVRPDWSDSSDLFGHCGLNGEFVPGAILDFIKKASDAAQADPCKPYFLCLDEMNLARVEYYFSDFLSIIETRAFDDAHKLTSEPLVKREIYGRDDDAAEKYGEIKYPPNLYVVGTVNMDETTFPFSKKVLDRANTIEFSDVNLECPSFEDAGEGERQSLSNAFFSNEYLQLKACADVDLPFVVDVCDQLQKLNEILRKANAHVGYRVRDEIVFYMLYNREFGSPDGLLTANEAMDNAIMQKLLPRLQGGNLALKKVLGELFDELLGAKFADYTGDTDAAKMEKCLAEHKDKYPKSMAKLAMMVRRFEEDGFTSYWL